MEIQIFIVFLLIINVFTLPIPDEEVSPAQTISGPVVKSDFIPKPEIKHVDIVESRLVAEGGSKSQVPINTSDSIEQKKIDISKNAPDAELPQLLLNKETTKNNQLTNIENKLEEVKILAERSSPVAAIEEQKQIVDEPKPEIINLRNKSDSTISFDSNINKEKIKEQLPNVVEIQIYKSELPSSSFDLTKSVTPLHSEDLKKELPTHQERSDEESAKEIKHAVDHIQHISQSTRNTNIKAEIKSLQPENSSEIAKEEHQSIEFRKTITENNIPEMKPLTADSVIKKIEEAHVSPVGDILLQSSEENNIKSLKNEKQTQSRTETKFSSTDKLKTQETEIKITEQVLTENLSQTKPIGQVVEEKIDLNKNLQESTESESSESKESGETKEKKKN